MAAMGRSTASHDQTLMYPDSPDANRLGCKCPANSGGNNRGDGTITDGVRSYTINPECALHGDPKWWCRKPKLPTPEAS